MYRRRFPFLRLVMLFGAPLACMLAATPAARAQTQDPRSLTPVGLGLGGPRIGVEVNDPTLVRLRGNTRPEATAINDRGRVADEMMLHHMMLLLRRTPGQEQALTEFVNDLHNPASPLFHHWITASEFGQKYGVPPAEVAKVTDWLESEGFKVNLVYPNQMVIDFTGTAGQIRQAFHTEIHHLWVNGEAHIANVSDPAIPAGLASTVNGIVSLNDFRLRPTVKLRPNYTTASGEDVVPGDLWKIYNFGPAFAAGISGQGQRIVAVEPTDLYTTSDFNNFRSTLGLTAFTEGSLTVVHPPSSPTNNCTDPGVNSNDLEATLDVEMVSAVAPSAGIVLASCEDTEVNLGVFIATQNLVNSSSPPAIISVSYGAAESEIGATGNAYVNSVFQQAVTEGTSVFVSTGDYGAAIADQHQFNVAVSGITINGLATTPYAVAVGGTDFGDNYEGTPTTYWSVSNATDYASALSYIPEIPWNDSCGSVLLGDFLGVLPTYGSGGLCNTGVQLDLSAGSGGASACATGAPDIGSVVGGTCAGYPKPSWQAGLFGNPSDGVRDIPDVSLFASAGNVWNHAYVFCFSDPDNSGTSCSGAPDTWVRAGGTSFSAPIWAGIQALINEASGSSWGNPDPAFYALARAEYGSTGTTNCKSTLGNAVGTNCVFYDVTQIPLLYTEPSGMGGDNDVPCLGMNCFAPSGTYGVLSTAPQPLTSVLVTGLGTGYTSGPSCNLSGGGGSGATCSASLTGVVTSIGLTNGGSGYTSDPTCTLTGGGGTGATCVVGVCTDNQVCAIALSNFGSGYTSAPSCTLTGGGGTGATCSTTEGSGISVSLTAPGSGYFTMPHCVLTGGGGTGGTCAALAINSSDAYEPAYTAGPGYDLATGIGTPNVSNLVASFTSATPFLSATAVTFPPQVVGTTSAAQTVTVSNTGSGNLIILKVTISGTNASDFAKSADTCTGATVVPTGTCLVSLDVTPSLVGPESASLDFYDIAANSPQTVSLTGTGRATGPSSGWQLEPGALSQVSVGLDGTVWGLNGAGQAYTFNPQSQTWQSTPGTFTQIAVGASGFVWALNAAGQIFRYDSATQSWNQIPGALSQIAVGADGDVWGLNSSGQIYHFNSATQGWVQISGALAQIAVGYDGAVWGLNAAQQIYRFNPGPQTWQQIPGALKRLAVGADGDVWGINNAGQTYHFDTLTQRWDNAPGSMAQIAVGSASNVWALDATGDVWRFNAQAQAWDQIPGQLMQIAAGANGAVWGVNNANQIYQFVQPTEPTQTFHQVAGSLAQVSAGLDGAAWGVDASQQIWRYNPQLQSLQQIPGTLSEIRVGFGGNVWGLNAAGQIYQFNPSTQGWNHIPGSLAQLEVGADGSVWGLNGVGQIYQFNSTSQTWNQIPGALAQLSVGADGTVWGLNSVGQIYRFNPSSSQPWVQIPGNLAQIAVGSANNVWGLNGAGQIYQFISTSQTWNHIPGSLAQLSVAFDGTVLGLNNANQIWRFNAQTQSWLSVPGALVQISVGADEIFWGLDASGDPYNYW